MLAGTDSRSQTETEADESTRTLTSELIPDRPYEFRVTTDDGVSGRHEWTISEATRYSIQIRDDGVVFSHSSSE